MRRLRYWSFIDAIGKGQFIRMYGRDVWDKLPKSAILRDGKRAYATREAVEDNSWGTRLDVPVETGVQLPRT